MSVKSLKIFSFILSFIFVSNLAQAGCRLAYHQAAKNMESEVKKARKTLRFRHAPGIVGGALTLTATNLLLAHSIKTYEPNHEASVITVFNIVFGTVPFFLGYVSSQAIYERGERGEKFRKASLTLEAYIELQLIEKILYSAMLYDQLQDSASKKALQESEEVLLNLRNRYKSLELMGVKELASRIYLSDISGRLCMDTANLFRLETAAKTVWSQN